MINKSDGTIAHRKNVRTRTFRIHIAEEMGAIISKEDLMDKKTFRTQALRRLRRLTPSQKRIADHRITRALLGRILARRAHTVMLYIPIGVEVDVMPLIDTLRRRGMVVLVPFMEGESFRLVQYRLPLHRRQFGVREPNFSNKYRNRQIDIAIVPIIGTDPTGRRVGFGKGMYDRFFAREGDAIAHVIFVQRTWQYAPCRVTDDWDVQADEVLVGRL